MSKREETADISDCAAVGKEWLVGGNPMVGSFFLWAGSRVKGADINCQAGSLSPVIPC